MSKIPPAAVGHGQPPSPEESNRIFAAAAAQGRHAAARISELVHANSLEVDTISTIEAHVRHGYKFINLVVRKDGIETTYEADWLARLFRSNEL